MEGGNGGEDRGLVGEAEASEAVESGVVVFDGLVGGCGVEGGHGLVGMVWLALVVGESAYVSYTIRC